MKIGIDFGTTRIVVAAADRGNYPLVNFEAPDGRVRDWFPSLLAVSDNRRVYGWDALEQQGKPGWTVVRSIKRRLKSAGPCSEIAIGGRRLNVSQIVTEMMTALYRSRAMVPRCWMSRCTTSGATSPSTMQGTVRMSVSAPTGCRE